MTLTADQHQRMKEVATQLYPNSLFPPYVSDMARVDAFCDQAMY